MNFQKPDGDMPDSIFSPVTINSSSSNATFSNTLSKREVGSTDATSFTADDTILPTSPINCIDVSQPVGVNPQPTMMQEDKPQDETQVDEDRALQPAPTQNLLPEESNRLQRWQSQKEEARDQPNWPLTKKNLKTLGGENSQVFLRTWFDGVEETASTSQKAKIIAEYRSTAVTTQSSITNPEPDVSQDSDQNSNVSPGYR